MPNPATILQLEVRQNGHGTPDFEKKLFKAHFQQFMRVFGDCLIFKTIKEENWEELFKV